MSLLLVDVPTSPRPRAIDAIILNLIHHAAVHIQSTGYLHLRRLDIHTSDIDADTGDRTYAGHLALAEL